MVTLGKQNSLKIEREYENLDLEIALLGHGPVWTLSCLATSGAQAWLAQIPWNNRRI